MTDSDKMRDPVEVLAEEFLDRHRQGERPSIAEYADAHPHWADRIRTLFPTLVMIEGLKIEPSSSADGTDTGATESEMPSQLGDFHIRREIGRGGMGVVYLAEQHSLGRLVALKVLTPEMMTSPRTVARFRREAQAAARLHHTNIVPVFGSGEDEGRHFYVMQYIEGQSLDRVVGTLAPSGTVDETAALSGGAPTVLEPDAPFALCSAEQVALQLVHGKIESSSARSRESQPSTASGTDASAEETGRAGQEPAAGAAPKKPRSGGGTLGRRYWRNVAAVGMQAAAAVHYAHRQGTLHRDIKPGNLILGQGGTVWVTDFGLAKLAEQDDLTRPGDMIGTLRYMAPEQLEGKSDVRSDIFSLGLTLYELLTLRPAFDASNRGKLLRQVSHGAPPRPRYLNHSIPRDLETIVLKAIAHEPERRYKTAGELAEDLERFLDDRPIRARRASPIEHGWRWCRRNPAFASVSALAAALLLLVLCGAAYRYHHRKIELEKSEANLRLAADAFEAIFAQIGGRSTSSAFADTADGALASAADGPVQVSARDALLLEKLLEFYDRFAEANRGNLNWLHETAVARRRMGEIYQRLGRFKEAETSYRRSLDEFAKLAATQNGLARLAVERALIHNELGNMTGAEGNFEDALREHEAALANLGGLSKDEVAPVSVRFELARTYLFLARGHAIRSLLGQNEPASAEQLKQIHRWLRDSLDLLEAISRTNPDNGDARFFMAECLHLEWLVSQLDGSAEDTAPSQIEAIGILERLVVDFPDDPRYQSALAHAYMVASRSPLTEGNKAITLKLKTRLERAVAMAENLVERYPERLEHKELVARCNCALADLLLDQGELDKAERLCERAIDMCEECRQEQPSRAFYQVGSLRAHTLLAGVRLLQGRVDEAQEVLDKAIEATTTMPPRIAESSIARRFLAEAWLMMAEVHRRRDVPELSEKATSKAEALIETLPEAMQQSLKTDRWREAASGSGEGHAIRQLDAPAVTVSASRVV